MTAIVFLGLGYVLGHRIDELRRLSTTDTLTGLANRRALQARLRDEWQRARRYTSPLSLLLIDIDGLKRINDKRGHAAGDEVLRTTARAINATMRATDFGARWAGMARARDAAVTISVGVATLEPRAIRPQP